MPGMIFGMNMAQGMNPFTAEQTQTKKVLSVDEQIEILKKLKELLDTGILSQEEFDAKKKEIMGVVIYAQ
jgi:predicted Zn-dependent peptidase